MATFKEGIIKEQDAEIKKLKKIVASMERRLLKISSQVIATKEQTRVNSMDIANLGSRR